MIPIPAFPQVDWSAVTEYEPLLNIARAILLVAIGVPCLKILGGIVGRQLRKRASEQVGMLADKGIFYIGTALFVVMALHQVGFKLGALLGAAGVAGIAIGFAAQTTLGNLISGIFLISEKPFQVGDLIKIGNTLGLVLAIDLLSVKLRMFNNVLVRIPNEQLLKTEFHNITRYPIRRLDINLGVAYKEDIRRVLKILKELAANNPYALDEPEPLIAFTGFGESQLNIFFGVWHSKDDFLALRDSILIEIKERFDAEGIEIPFPHRTLYVGSATEPVPIQHLRPPTRWRAAVDGVDGDGHPNGHSMPPIS